MQLKGIYAPIVTPFNADESINYPVLEQLIEYLIANKIAGLVPGGTTGEVYAFTEAERLEIFKFTKEKVNGGSRSLQAPTLAPRATLSATRKSPRTWATRR